MRMVLMTISFGALALPGSVLAAQDAREAATSRNYQLGGFDEVAVVGPHHVVISVGPAYSVRAEGPQRTLDDTEVEVEDGRLRIRPVDDDRWERRCEERGSERRRCWNDYEAATFHITLPALEKVSLAGGGDMRVDRVEGGEFAALVAGSGDIDVASLRVDDARFTIAGSGDLAARGSARRSRVSIAGSGNLLAQEVRSDEASITIAGSGDAALTVENDARVSIVGSGDVEIAGPARCSVTRMGGGRVRCGGETIAS